MRATRPSSRFLGWSAIGLAGAAALILALAYVALAGASGPNYMAAPTIACLRSNGFTIDWESPPYRFEQAKAWASIGITRNGQVVNATFAPSPALARQMAPTSGFTVSRPWIRRNVVFSNDAGSETKPILHCLRGSPRRK